MSEFPQTLAALKEVEMEEGPQPRQCASDSAYWAVGDALIEECGTDPVWDYDEGKMEFKGGLKLYEGADWLEEHGVGRTTGLGTCASFARWPRDSRPIRARCR